MTGYELSLGIFPKPHGKAGRYRYREPRPVFEEKDMAVTYCFCFYVYICKERERDICTYMIIFWWYWLRVGDDRLRSGWWERWPDICIGKGYICDTYACMSVCVNGFSVKWFSNFLKEYKSGFLTKPSFCLPLQSFEFITSRIHQIEFQQ